MVNEQSATQQKVEGLYLVKNEIAASLCTRAAIENAGEEVGIEGCGQQAALEWNYEQEQPWFRV